MNKPRIIIIIILTAILIVLWFIDHQKLFPNFHDYSVNFFTEVVGIFITVLIVDYLFSRHTEKQKRKKIVEQISRSNKIFNTYLKSFNRYAYFVVTPLAKRKYGLDVSFNREFAFKDMYDLLEPSGMTTDNFEEPVVLKCLAIVKSIKTCSEAMLNNIDLESFPELSDVLISFVEFISKTDFSDGIKYDAFACFLSNNEPVKNSIKKAIQEFKDEPKIIGSNALDKYIGVYYMLKGLSVLVTAYEEKINDILK